jgi:uncharacterized protein YciI
VEAASKGEIEALMRTGPFWVHGLRERHEIHAWSKAHPQRKTAI